MTSLARMPAAGRCFGATRTVRLGDADTRGRLRLDALGRYLQDVGMDDVAAAGLEAVTWVARRVVVEVSGWPRIGQRVELTTFCSGAGSRWAERRVSLRGPSSAIETATIWVFVDRESGRPVPLPADFDAVYGEASGGRRVSGRLTHDGPPPGAEGRPWPLRVTDFDVLGHVNNAAVWAPVEDELARNGHARELRKAELEFHRPIPPEVTLQLVSRPAGPGRVDLWLIGADEVHVSARLFTGSRSG